jgi:HEAT repeat protein
MVLHRVLELALSEEAPAAKVMALEVVGAAKLADFRDQARALLLSTDKDVALAATMAIGSIGNKIDIATLEEFTSGERPASPGFCAAAATSLGILGRGPQVAMAAASNLQSPNRDARRAALAVLSKLELESGEAVAVLAKILGGANKSSREERALAAAALGRQATRYAPALKALLAGTSSTDAALRTSCVEAIASSAKAGTRSRLAYWKVLELVRTKDERVRAAAVVALAALDPLRFSKEIQSVRAGGSQLVIMSMASVLGDLPGPIALRRLLDLAGVPNVGMRSAAALGLAKRQDDKAKMVLRSLLADAAPSVRVAALRSLTSEDELKPLLQDESTEVRVAALAALVTQLGKAQTARSAATMIAGTGPDRDLQVRLAKSWLVAGQ